MTVPAFTVEVPAWAVYAVLSGVGSVLYWFVALVIGRARKKFLLKDMERIAQSVGASAKGITAGQRLEANVDAFLFGLLWPAIGLAFAVWVVGYVAFQTATWPLALLYRAINKGD